MSMSRDHVTTPSISITTSVATTPIIDKSGFPWGRIYIPAGSSITTLTFYDQPHSTATDGKTAKSTDAYFTAKDSAGAAVTLTVAAGESYPMPEAVATSPNLRITGNAAGSIIIAFMG